MSARGARSRKVQQKDIDKKERKVGKNKAIESINEPHNGFANWRTTPSSNGNMPGISRSMTISSSASRGTSQSSGTVESSDRPRLNALRSNESLEGRAAGSSQSVAGASTSTSGISSNANDKTKFQSKGKETRAPRGRGGGVPIKKSATQTPVAGFRSESAASYAFPNQKTWSGFKVWDGGKNKSRPYGGFELDEDMQIGSVLVYFKEEQTDHDIPLPSIRADLDVLRQSGSTWLNNVLMYGRLDDDDNDWALPAGSASSMQPPPQRMLRPTSPVGRSPPPFDIDQAYDGRSTRTASRLDRFSQADPSYRSGSPPHVQRIGWGIPTHEIWFTAPDHVNTPQGQRLHHVAVRNFLALLHGKPIVGADLFDMLNTLQPEIETKYELDIQTHSSMTPRERSVQMITNYLGQHGIDDVRSSIKSAMCLLAWAEQDNVRWRQGYLETFVHLAGVMIPELEEVKEFKRLSIVTRRNLGIAAKTLKLRVMEAEEKLSTFDFSDLWEDSSRITNGAAYNSYQAFRQFLISHYTRNHGNWPPATNKTWLNRKIILALQEDFGSLYDYLVNRDVVWNPREERASRKWEMAHRKIDGFKADVPELGITDLLVRYDAKFGYAHIPHPYPLLPRELPKISKEKDKKSFLSSLKKDKSKDVAKDAKAHLQLSILFSDATNIEKLDVNFNGSTLIDKFEQFEMTTDLKSTTPREARLGRWVLLYGILQVLSTLSVDVQALKYTDGVRHLLCTDLKRCPEWVINGQLEHLEARQQRSWCWQRAWDPAPTQTAPVELEAVPSQDCSPDTDRDIQYPRHAISSNQPQQSPPPLLDDRSLLQNDIHRIGEKIDNLSLFHHAKHTHRREYELRRENEKVIQSEFHDRKPRLDSLSPPQQHTLSTMAQHHHHHQNDNFYLSESDMSDAGTLVPPPSRNITRQTVGSMNTDLGGYPFSPEELQWPVPPGYSEGNHRESGIGYSAGSWNGHLEVGDGARRGVHERYLDARVREVDRRSPRRMYERSGWN